MEKVLRFTAIDADIRAIRVISKAMKKEGWVDPIYGFENEVYTLEMSRNIMLVPEGVMKMTASDVENLFCDMG